MPSLYMPGSSRRYAREACLVGRGTVGGGLSVSKLEDPELKPNQLPENFKTLEENVSRPQSKRYYAGIEADFIFDRKLRLPIYSFIAMIWTVISHSASRGSTIAVLLEYLCWAADTPQSRLDNIERHSHLRRLPRPRRLLSHKERTLFWPFFREFFFIFR